jgi:hypothetical protein
MWGVFRYELEMTYSLLLFWHLVILMLSSWWINGCMSMVAG